MLKCVKKIFHANIVEYPKSYESARYFPGPPKMCYFYGSPPKKIGKHCARPRQTFISLIPVFRKKTKQI